MTLTLSQRLRVHAACTDDRVELTITPEAARTIAAALDAVCDIPVSIAEIKAMQQREEANAEAGFRVLLAFAVLWPLAVWGLLA
jgi:hypothetical protein